MCLFSPGTCCQSGGQIPSSLNCWSLLLNSKKQICVNPETHLWITYWSADVMVYAFIPVSSQRDLHQSRKGAHYSYLWKLSGSASPRLLGLLCGCHANADNDLTSRCLTKAGLGFSSKGHFRVSKTEHSKHSSITTLGSDVDEMWLYWGLSWWAFPLQQLVMVGGWEKGKGFILDSLGVCHYW